MNSEAKPRRNLGLRQAIQVAEWLRTQEEWLHHERPSWEEAAAKVSTVLGFPVSDAQLARVCKEIDLAWKRRGSDGGASRWTTMKEEFAALHAQLEEQRVAAELRLIAYQKLEAEVTVLRGVVHHLYHELGAKPPPGYLLPTVGHLQTSVVGPAPRSGK